MNQRILPDGSEIGRTMCINRVVSLGVPFLKAIVLTIAMQLLTGNGLVLADTHATDRLITHHLVKRADGVVVRAVSVQLPSVALQRVSLSSRGVPYPRLSSKPSDINDPGVAHSFFSNLMIERHSNHVVVSGWRAVQVKPENKWRNESLQYKQLQRIFFQEVRITLPYSVATGGWDVRSLERELERLGIKVKPKPSLPRPTPQLSG